ncbi:hypothetical protein JHD46_05290 [Sulfurimonas sp. SAG-AH-194-C20]|nr:hypothetical protein [Sulfurimonas sp. SAG-AH-194-C20]MDF1879053.1 hypothetical protein [Sulfurimonas sp. SAG-AH-194-C20]
MTVLTILALLIGIYGIYLFIQLINKYTYMYYQYDFFNMKNLIVTTMGYLALFFGYKWHEKALQHQQDLLNGQVLFALGLLLIIYVIYENVKKTNLLIGLFFSAIQLVLYIGISVISIILALGMLAAFAPNRYGYYDDY